jgi:hypothetical protein
LSEGRTQYFAATAVRFISCFEAARARLKRLGEAKLLAILDQAPGMMSEAASETVMQALGTSLAEQPETP